MSDSKQVKKEAPGREKEFSTITELAQRTGKCYRTIHRAVKAGKIKTVHFGASRLIPRREAERVLERGF
jgi:excisionase family DNA binding protein